MFAHDLQQIRKLRVSQRPLSGINRNLCPVKKLHSPPQAIMKFIKHIIPWRRFVKHQT
jgi:hypothetical protein